MNCTIPQDCNTWNKKENVIKMQEILLTLLVFCNQENSNTKYIFKQED